MKSLVSGKNISTLLMIILIGLYLLLPREGFSYSFPSNNSNNNSNNMHYVSSNSRSLNNQASMAAALNAINKSLDRVNTNILASQDIIKQLKEQQHTSFENSDKKSADRWQGYKDMQKEALHPDTPMPSWKDFVSMDNAEPLTQGRQLKGFVYTATSNKVLLSQLNQALSVGVDNSIEAPLKMNLAKSVSESSNLQVLRLNTALSLQSYRLQVVQVQALNRLTNLVSLVLINNDMAQKRQYEQLQKIYNQLRVDLKK